MACCLAIAFVFAAVRRMIHPWSGAPRDSSQAQAPPARRPAPGAAPTLVVDTAELHPLAQSTAGLPQRVSLQLTQSRPAQLRPAQLRPDSPRAASPKIGGLLLGASLGTLLYTVTVGWLFSAGVAQPISGAGFDRRAMSAALLAVAVVGLVAAARRRGTVRPGRVAMGMGAALELLSLVDMHLLSPFELAGGNPLVDVAFHSAGPLIAVAGALFELRPLRSAPTVAIETLR